MRLAWHSSFASRLCRFKWSIQGRARHIPNQFIRNHELRRLRNGQQFRHEESYGNVRQDGKRGADCESAKRCSIHWRQRKHHIQVRGPCDAAAMIYKAMYAYENEVSNIEKGDVVEHEEQWWLVSRWLLDISSGRQRPERLVAIAPFDPQTTTFAGCRWMIKRPVPRFLFDDPAPQVEGTEYVVLLSPEVWFPISPSETTLH